MRRTFRVMGVVGALGLTWGAGAPLLFAQQEAAATVRKIGWVNLDRVFKEYKRTQTLEAKLEGLSKTKQSEREKKVSEIRSLRDELLLLNDQGRAQQQQTVEQRLRELAGFDQQAKETFRNERESAVRHILEEIESAVTAFAKEKGYDLILTDRAVLYGVEALDVTDPISSILNENYGKKSQ